jgi:hypothetical protein
MPVCFSCFMPHTSVSLSLTPLHGVRAESNKCWIQQRSKIYPYFYSNIRVRLMTCWIQQIFNGRTTFNYGWFFLGHEHLCEMLLRASFLIDDRPLCRRAEFLSPMKDRPFIRAHFSTFARCLPPIPIRSNLLGSSLQNHPYRAKIPQSQATNHNHLIFITYFHNSRLVTFLFLVVCYVSFLLNVKLTLVSLYLMLGEFTGLGRSRESLVRRLLIRIAHCLYSIRRQSVEVSFLSFPCCLLCLFILSNSSSHSVCSIFCSVRFQDTIDRKEVSNVEFPTQVTRRWNQSVANPWR